MSEYTRAVFATLEQGQTDFTQTFNALTHEVSALDGQLRSSLSAWDSQAQQAYTEAKAQWDTAMADMAQVLAQLGAVVGAANANYQVAEATNSALWG
jgi:6 kDa early secretory antigenic target